MAVAGETSAPVLAAGSTGAGLLAVCIFRIIEERAGLRKDASTGKSRLQIGGFTAPTLPPVILNGVKDLKKLSRDAVEPGDNGLVGSAQG
jgi:hypothetical protein